MIRPNLIERACGGWLAVTPDGSNLSFGVTAETKELALAAFYKSLKKWQEALVSK